MFISLCKKIKQQLKEKKAWRQVLAYGILAFLIMQCYVLPFASENTEAWESVATIGDATWTNALPQDIQADAEESAFTESEETVQSVSPSAILSGTGYIQCICRIRDDDSEGKRKKQR